MKNVYDPDQFAYRVEFAAAVIRRKGEHTRRFDTCFEMNDGDAVAAALWRRAAADPAGRLAANIRHYLREGYGPDLSHIPTRALAAEAARQRSTRA